METGVNISRINSLLNYIEMRYGLRNDRQLADLLHCTPAQISRLRTGYVSVHPLRFLGAVFVYTDLSREEVEHWGGLQVAKEHLPFAVPVETPVCSR